MNTKPINWKAPGYKVKRRRERTNARERCEVCRRSVETGDEQIIGPRGVAVVHARCVGREGEASIGVPGRKMGAANRALLAGRQLARLVREVLEQRQGWLGPYADQLAYACVAVEGPIAELDRRAEERDG